jgi:uncharacterized protein
MEKISFENIKFKKDFSSDNFLIGKFMKIFSLKIPLSELDFLKDFRVNDLGEIEFNTNIDSTKTQRIIRRFNVLLAKSFNTLKNELTKKRAIYVHKNSGIPLFGSNDFGLVDRGTNIIEIKPITGCNLNCIYCSVNQDKRSIDFVVEPDYLLEEFKVLYDIKESNYIEAHIGTQGEPLLYSQLVYLINGLSKFDRVKTISIDTNATMLDTKKVDELVNAGLTRFNLSLNSLDSDNAIKISGSKAYNLDFIKKIITYISKKANLIIAPVIIPGFNSSEIKDLIFFVKDLRKNTDKEILLGLQNFLEYKGGKKPVKQISMDRFYDDLSRLEKEFNETLVLNKGMFKIKKDLKLPLPFKKNDIISVEIVAPARKKNEVLGVNSGRVITIKGSTTKIAPKIKITRSKHNVFNGVFVSS